VIPAASASVAPSARVVVITASRAVIRRAVFEPAAATAVVVTDRRGVRGVFVPERCIFRICLEGVVVGADVED